MSSDAPEVRCCTRLPRLLGSCRAEDSGTVGNMLYGMQGMSSDAPEVRLLLHAF
jgi:hypothetical protein